MIVLLVFLHTATCCCSLIYEIYNISIRIIIIGIIIIGIIIITYNNTRNICNMIIVTAGTYDDFFSISVIIPMSLFLLDQSVIISADYCSIGTFVLLQTSNTVLLQTYLNMGHGVCRSIIITKTLLGQSMFLEEGTL